DSRTILMRSRRTILMHSSRTIPMGVSGVIANGATGVMVSEKAPPPRAGGNSGGNGPKKSRRDRPTITTTLRRHRTARMSRAEWWREYARDKIVVMGDANADWLAYGLEDAFSEQPEIGIVRKHRTASGLIRYDQRRDIECPQLAREIIAAEKPKFVVMMIGNN